LCLCGIGAVRTRKGTASYHPFRLSKCTNAGAPPSRGLPVILITGYAAGEQMRGMEVLRKLSELAALTDLVKARLEL